ncbi:hypothetical protein DFH11DRAFT_409156 [Phellopilus nigrolimitatus]|nr:hypothetical protein DFH11DRAFT_409156 [Phellopilus nigrolimitatus]
MWTAPLLFLALMLVYSYIILDDVSLIKALYGGKDDAEILGSRSARAIVLRNTLSDSLGSGLKPWATLAMPCLQEYSVRAYFSRCSRVN